jgi:acetyl-CoA C-acetyltransferase
VIAHATQGVSPGDEARAPLLALEKALKPNGSAKPMPEIVEMSEASAAQLVALSRQFDIDEDNLNPHGGAIARGYPLGAASAVSVVRLFSTLARDKAAKAKFGAVTQGAAGGLGVATLFERV